MKFHVYMIIAKKISRYITYVGYSKNIEKRLILHVQKELNLQKEIIGKSFTKGNTILNQKL